MVSVLATPKFFFANSVPFALKKFYLDFLLYEMLVVFAVSVFHMVDVELFEEVGD
jgi:hypothetical protein